MDDCEFIWIPVKEGNPLLGRVTWRVLAALALNYLVHPVKVTVQVRTGELAESTGDVPAVVRDSGKPAIWGLTDGLRIVTLWSMADMQTITAVLASGAPMENDTISMNIGTTIRGYRLQKGMSQGDIEKKTGLLRCYLSRVENGHTVPSLETLQKIARALDLQLSEFFAEEVVGKEMSSLNLNEDEIRFLTQVQRYSAHLNEGDRRLLLAMVRKFAQTSLS
jgi:transcriptional regulator with XRE-family HTH domain